MHSFFSKQQDTVCSSVTDVTYVQNSTWPVIIKLIPARESLLSDVKIAFLFYSVGHQIVTLKTSLTIVRLKIYHHVLKHHCHHRYGSKDNTFMITCDIMVAQDYIMPRSSGVAASNK